MLGVSVVVAPLHPAEASAADVEALRLPLESLGFDVSMCGMSGPSTSEEE